ncbi:replication protein RepA [Alteromonas gilva]|uniref:Replication protein RepA n=1 Tax=Alteromonas gilva TaxID=2987522 RepID=A0ABT5L6C0_9ALTE|nr:replication protein RepA [Alteromonas gilva]MDC8832610.1 replication protein RepA [Alteromonas gilva]
MSLINLSRSTQSAERSTGQQVSADDFIDEALDYATGNVAPLKASQLAAIDKPANSPMHRATFTLTQQCIEQLTEMSAQSGMAKSRLIRLWIQHFSSIDSKL